MNVAQPLVLIDVVALCLIAKQENRSAARSGRRLPQLMGQPEPLGRVGSRLRLGIADGLQQVRQKGALRMLGLVLALRVEGGDFGVVAGEQEPYVLDRPGLANA